jgi:hypothetical protein
MWVHLSTAHKIILPVLETHVNPHPPIYSGDTSYKNSAEVFIKHAVYFFKSFHDTQWITWGSRELIWLLGHMQYQTPFSKSSMNDFWILWSWQYFISINVYELYGSNYYLCVYTTSLWSTDTITNHVFHQTEAFYWLPMAAILLSPHTKAPL